MAVELSVLRGQHGAAPAPALLPGLDRPRARRGAVRDGGDRARQRLARRLRRHRPRPRRHDRGDRARAAARQGRERLDAAAAGARALRAAAQRGLRARAGRDDGAARGARRASPEAAVAGATLVTHEGEQEPSAWRFPGPADGAADRALAAPPLRRAEPRQRRSARVDWVQSAALLVRRDAAEAIGYLDPAFFVFSDEVDFCKRLRDAGWDVLYVPSARAVGHDAPARTSRRDGSSSSPATATATCASTMAPRPPAPCAG